MTPTQIARRSDALYEDNTGSMTRRVLCDMVAQRESDLEDAMAENAKLRELVRELWRTMDLLNACDVSEYDEPLNCIYCEQWGTVGKNIVGCKLKYRMRELGVEVDE